MTKQELLKQKAELEKQLRELEEKEKQERIQKIDAEIEEQQTKVDEIQVSLSKEKTKLRELEDEKIELLKELNKKIITERGLEQGDTIKVLTGRKGKETEKEGIIVKINKNNVKVKIGKTDKNIKYENIVF